MQRFHRAVPQPLFDTDGLMPGVWRDVVLDELTSNLESRIALIERETA